jgi:hypothetical protein
MVWVSKDFLDEIECIRKKEGLKKRNEALKQAINDIKVGRQFRSNLRGLGLDTVILGKK